MLTMYVDIWCIKDVLDVFVVWSFIFVDSLV
jgi:hypothetical protein